MRDVLAIVFDAPSWEEAVAGDTGGDSTAHRTGAGLLSRLLTAAVPVCVLAHSDAVADTVHEWTAANGVTSASASGVLLPCSEPLTLPTPLKRGTPLSQAPQSPAYATPATQQPKKRLRRT